MKPTVALNAIILVLSVCLLSCIQSHTPDSLPGAWDKLSTDFEGNARGGAAYFTIGDTVYVGTGFSYEDGRLNDLWKLDPVTNTWARKSDFPGAERSNAVAFSLNGKGYLGTGTSNDITLLNDFYEFDPTTSSGGTWKKIADFPSARTGSLAFTVKNRAFVGGGHDSADLKDLWEYDQNNDAWVQQGSMSGYRRQNGFVMVIDDIAYVGGGTSNGVFNRDFNKFDVTQLSGYANGWTMLNSLTGKDINGNSIAQPGPRKLASTFTIEGKGYLVCGAYTSGALGDTWQYDPLNDSWKQFYSLSSNKPTSGFSRSEAIGFALTTPSGIFGYLTTGGGNSISDKYSDFWKFDPKGREPDNK